MRGFKRESAQSYNGRGKSTLPMWGKGQSKIAESSACHNQATRRQGDTSRLGPRVPEHGDLVITTVGDEDLVTVNKGCSNITDEWINANSLYDVA